MPTHLNDRPSPNCTTILLLISTPSGLQQFYNHDRFKAAWTASNLPLPKVSNVYINSPPTCSASLTHALKGTHMAISFTHILRTRLRS